jgi:hypothetical protein
MPWTLASMSRKAKARSLPPGGVLALIAQKGYEQVRDGEAVPTIGETIAASRALNAAETERLREELDEERRRVRVLITVLEETSPDALRSLTGSSPELPAKSEVVILPEAGANDPTAVEEGSSGYTCEIATPWRSPEAVCFSTSEGSIRTGARPRSGKSCLDRELVKRFPKPCVAGSIPAGGTIWGVSCSDLAGVRLCPTPGRCGRCRGPG